MSNKIKIAIKIIATIAVFILLFYFLNDNYNNIRKYQFTIDQNYLFFSFISLIITILFIPYIWYSITKAFNCNLSLKDSIYIRLKSEMGKYLPGRILGYGYLIMHYKDAGMDNKRVLNSSLYELLLSTISAFIFFTITLCFCNYEKLNEFKSIFILISVLSIILLHPYLLNKILNYIYKLLKKDKYDLKITYSELLKFLLLYLFVWVLWGVSIFFFVNAFIPLPLNKVVYLSGVFAASTFVGFMAFILPAGLGAREGMLVFFLTSLIGFIPSIVVSIGSRIWMIFGDIVLFLAALILSKLQNTRIIEK